MYFKLNTAISLFWTIIRTVKAAVLMNVKINIINMQIEAGRPRLNIGSVSLYGYTPGNIICIPYLQEFTRTSVDGLHGRRSYRE